MSIKAILLHSGVAAYLPEAIKQEVCRQVANDLTNYLKERVEKAALNLNTKQDQCRVSALLVSEYPKYGDAVAKAQLDKVKEEIEK